MAQEGDGAAETVALEPPSTGAHGVAPEPLSECFSQDESGLKPSGFGLPQDGAAETGAPESLSDGLARGTDSIDPRANMDGTDASAAVNAETDASAAVIADTGASAATAETDASKAASAETDASAAVIAD